MGGTSTVLRDATPQDLETIARFQEAMAVATEGRRLDPARVRAGVGKALRDPDRGFYLVAEVAGRPAGSLLVTREWSDWRDGWLWWIQSVWVEEAFRRRGVYRALHAAVRARARAAADVAGIRLYVDRDNAAAQSAYEAVGMGPARYVLFEEELD